MDDLRIRGALVTFLVHALVGAAIVWTASASSGDGSFTPEKAQVVEAQLAFRKESKKKLVQKRTRKLRHKVKPTGVSRDADKKAKPDKKKPDQDKAPDLDKFLRKDPDIDPDTDEDLEPAKDTKSNIGSFDGSKFGSPDVTTSKGHPYMGRLAADMKKVAKIPEFEKGTGAAVGCLRLDPSGKIIDTKLWKKSGNVNIDGAVKLGLRKLKQLRNKTPLKLPTELLSYTTFWTCFKLTD